MDNSCSGIVFLVIPSNSAKSHIFFNGQDTPRRDDDLLTASAVKVAMKDGVIDIFVQGHRPLVAFDCTYQPTNTKPDLHQNKSGHFFYNFPGQWSLNFSGLIRYFTRTSCKILPRTLKDLRRLANANVPGCHQISKTFFTILRIANCFSAKSLLRFTFSHLQGSQWSVPSIKQCRKVLLGSRLCNFASAHSNGALNGLSKYKRVPLLNITLALASVKLVKKNQFTISYGTSEQKRFSNP